MGITGQTGLTQQQNQFAEAQTQAGTMVSQLAAGQSVTSEALGQMADQLAPFVGLDATHEQAIGTLRDLYQSLDTPRLRGELIGTLITPTAARALPALLDSELAGFIDSDGVTRLQQIAHIDDPKARLRQMIWFGIDQGALPSVPGLTDARATAMFDALNAQDIATVLTLLPASPSERTALAQAVASNRGNLARGLQALGRSQNIQAQDFFYAVQEHMPRANAPHVLSPGGLGSHQPTVSDLNLATLSGMVLAPNTVFDSMAAEAGGYPPLQRRAFGIINESKGSLRS
jgi:hypothetical protein